MRRQIAGVAALPGIYHSDEFYIAIELCYEIYMTMETAKVRCPQMKGVSVSTESSHRACRAESAQQGDSSRANLNSIKIFKIKIPRKRWSLFKLEIKNSSWTHQPKPQEI